MPTKKPKKKDTKSSNPLRALVIILAVTFAILGCIALLRYIFDLQYQQKLLKEDITFARIETFVNIAKVRLEQEFPEAEWRVESFCDPPNSKASIEGYGCSYFVTTPDELAQVRLKEVAYSISNNMDVRTDRDYSTLTIRLESIGETGNCYFLWSDVNSTTSLICTHYSDSLRYLLDDR